MAQITHLQHPVGQDHKQSEESCPPTPVARAAHTRHQPAAVGPVHQIRPTSEMDLSRLLREREKQFLSFPTYFFRVPIDIDIPHNDQAVGGLYTPPRTITLPSRIIAPPPRPALPPPSTPWNTSIPPPQSHPSSEHWTHPLSQPLTPTLQYPQTTSINPPPVVTGPVNNKYVSECQTRSLYLQVPYPRLILGASRPPAPQPMVTPNGAIHQASTLNGGELKGYGEGNVHK